MYTDAYVIARPLAAWRWITWPSAWAPSMSTRQPQLAAAAQMSLTGMMMEGTEVMWEIWGRKCHIKAEGEGGCEWDGVNAR